MYATKDNLSIRIHTHERYTQPKIDFPNWVLDHITWRGDERVLDIGCGAGLYINPVLKRLTGKGILVAVDISLGMLKDVKSSYFLHQVDLINADAGYLPFSEDNFDVILANHMLYYVSNIEKILGGIKRLLRPGGYFIAATNSQFSMLEFTSEMEEARRILGYPPIPATEKERTNFNLENGHLPISKVFSDVSQDTLKTTLVFNQSHPVIDYINSLRPSEESKLPKGLSWESMVEQVTKQVSQKIKQHSEYRVPKTTGVFIATNRT